MPFTVRDEDLAKYHGDRNHWHEVYQGLILPAAESAGFRCERDDEDISTRLIVDAIWQKIESAEVVLCDLSASNPNVYMELGWALRGDKRFVLIKDDVTSRPFDLTHVFSFEYSHKLQPTNLKSSIATLANVLQSTAADTERRYSMVARLSLHLTAIKASNAGDVSVGMMQELLAEVRSSKVQSSPPTRGALAGYRQRAKLRGKYEEELAGTVWRKANGWEVIMFRPGGLFDYYDGERNRFESFAYRKVGGPRPLVLEWRGGFKAECHFLNDGSQFAEVHDPSCVWHLEWAF